MKKINTGFVVDPTIQQPFTTKSLDFLQENSREMIGALCRNVIANRGYNYSGGVPYYIGQLNASFPCDGTVFFNGELYLLTENTGGLLYAILDTAVDATYDPLLFTDNVNRNVHENRRLTFTNTLSGSLFAIADMVNVATYDFHVPTMLNLWSAGTYISAIKTQRNRIELRGIATKTTSNNLPIFLLPVGYRPLTDVYLNVNEISSGVSNANALLIATDGNVTLVTPSGLSNVSLILNGLFYYL